MAGVLKIIAACKNTHVGMWLKNIERFVILIREENDRALRTSFNRVQSTKKKMRLIDGDTDQPHRKKIYEGSIFRSVFR
jgi:hypothetical protein